MPGIRHPDVKGLVLPGVGAFRDCMASLIDHDLVGVIRDVIAEDRPFLGICLGLQMLFSESEEMGLHEGLGVIPGRVVRFDHDLKIPQSLESQVASGKPFSFKLVRSEIHDSDRPAIPGSPRYAAGHSWRSPCRTKPPA